MIPIVNRIPKILETPCGRHSRPVGIPCFHVPKLNGFGYYAGVCDFRAKKFYIGKISLDSIRKKPTKK